MKTIYAVAAAAMLSAMPVAADAETFSFNFAFEQVVGGVPQGTGYTAMGTLDADAVAGLYTVNAAIGRITNTFDGSMQAISSATSAVDGIAPATFRLDGGMPSFADINFNFYSFAVEIVPGSSRGFAVEAMGPLTVASITPSVSGAVPEPASWALMIAGVAVAGGALRRRRTTVAFA